MFAAMRLIIRFSLCGDMLRLSYYSIAAFTLSAKAECFRQLEGACKKCDFCARKKFCTARKSREAVPCDFLRPKGDTAASLRLGCGFSLFAPFLGHAFYLWAQIHPLPQSQSVGKSGCAAQKRGFACAKSYSPSRKSSQKR